MVRLVFYLLLSFGTFKEILGLAQGLGSKTPLGGNKIGRLGLF